MLSEWFHPNSIHSLITYSISLIVLTIGSLTDLKTREVPDWVNYGLIFSGIGINLLFSAILWDYSYILRSLLGLAIFFGIAWVMFYTGQWGGGDSKMLMGLGAMIGIDFQLKIQFLPMFFIYTLFIGAIYGLFWSFFLAYKNRKKFTKEFKKNLTKEKVVKIKQLIVLALIVSIILFFFIEDFFIKTTILSLILLVIITFYLWIFVKAVEKTSMFKLVTPNQLTEGDWIAKNIYYKKKYICGPKDLGVEKKQIKKLIALYRQKKIKKILIKEGIPFVPSFLIAFIITFVLGNPLT